MKITRNYAGANLEINLTEEEMQKVYEEVQFQKDMAEVDDAIAVTCLYGEVPADVIKELTQTFQMQKQKEIGTFALASRVIEENKILLEPYKKEEYHVYEIECTQTRSRKYTVRARSSEEADQIFEEWRNKNLDEYDADMSDADLDDDDISSAYECEGNPEYADIKGDEY